MVLLSTRYVQMHIRTDQTDNGERSTNTADTGTFVFEVKVTSLILKPQTLNGLFNSKIMCIVFFAAHIYNSTVFNLFTTIHDGNFRRHSSMNVTIK